MIIMSIDQSLSASGVIIWDDGMPIYFEVVKTPPKVEVILRIQAIRLTLTELILRYKVKHVVIESLPFGLNSTSVRPLAALYYFLQDMCLGIGITFGESHVTKVKKLATGSGKAKKKEMIEAVSENASDVYQEFIKAGYKLTTGLADLADSYWIYQLYKKETDDAT